MRIDREYEGIGAWGPVGDFFGGMLNPILAFASFIALLYTIRIQSEELRLTREEFSKSVDAQERLAKEAENGLNRQLCFEDYAHVIKRFRGEIGALNRLRRESIPKADFPRSSNPPKSINNLVQQISLNFMATAKGESENAESCFDRAYQKYNPFAPEDKNIFYEVVAEKINQFLMDAIALKNSLKIYKTCCKKIVQNDVQSMIREDDIRSALSILAFAYIVSRIFKTPDSKYYYSYYKPTESDDLKMFKEILGNFGLPTKALETL